MSVFSPRAGQREILDYQEGKMGVSAVPGSGKTTTIAALTARLIARGVPHGGQVLVVTYQNAAVDNVKARIRQELEAMDLLQVGYDVRTLHSLSYGIIQGNPGLAGTTADFVVLDERTSNNLLDKAVRIWNAQNVRVWGRLAPADYFDERWEREWRRIAQNIAQAVIRSAKNMRVTAERLLELVGDSDVTSDQFLRIGAQIYQLYQQQVQTIGGLDFNDLVWQAVDLLEHHPDLTQRLSRRWSVVLEDEAQDSVPLQEELLSLLTGEGGHLIRVGDPNQSIMSTFTAADPRYLRRFLERPEVETVEMAISGRCSARIIDLANRLVEWVCDSHPLVEVRQRAFRMQFIQTTEAGDPQQNPPDAESSMAFREYNNRNDEFADVARRAMQFVEKNGTRTASILVPTNRMGYEMADQLRAMKAPFDEMLQSSRPERQVTEALSSIVLFLGDPLRRNYLESAYLALRQLLPMGEGGGDVEKVATLLRSCYRPETLLFPTPDRKPEDALPSGLEVAAEDLEEIVALSVYLRRWLRAKTLPIDQLLMTVAQDILQDVDLARAQKLASYLRHAADQNIDWRLPELARELEQIARGRIKVLDDEDATFEPRQGVITLTTMHRAKGLEWDLVYLLGVDGDWFPHTLEDSFRGAHESFGSDPAEEARAALLAVIGAGEDGKMSATDAAHAEIIAERLRLLYVGITRARQYLAVSWSREIPAGMRLRPVPQAAAYHHLAHYYKREYGDGK
jgi:DNA helicase-2/ATP-dependent DNA helicase PcrA